VGSGRQIQRHSPCFQAHEEHLDRGVIGEGGDHPVPLIHAHAALQPHTLHPHLHQLHCITHCTPGFLAKVASAALSSELTVPIHQSKLSPESLGCSKLSQSTHKAHLHGMNHATDHGTSIQSLPPIAIDCRGIKLIAATAVKC
jgi:hypothetical protein